MQGSIANLYDSDKSFGKRTDKEPLKSWTTLDGDVIWFMVSSLTIDTISNGQERSNMMQVTLPSRDGIDPITNHPPCSEDSTGPHCSSENCNIPNRAGIIRDFASDYEDEFQEAQEFNQDMRDGNVDSEDIADDSRWAFMDRALGYLHETDPHWGLSL